MVEQEDNLVDVLQVLNAVLEELGVSPETKFTKLSYIPAEINIQPVFALVDSGATHNFVKEEMTNDESICRLSQERTCSRRSIHRPRGS